MNCPYCNKIINAMTGYQEAVKFQKHLKNCKKNPKRLIITETNKLPYFSDTYNHTETVNLTPTSLSKALDIRAKSNQ